MVSLNRHPTLSTAFALEVSLEDNIVSDQAIDDIFELDEILNS